MVVSPECEGYYTPEPGEVIHQGRGKCQNCSRAEELLNSQALEPTRSSIVFFLKAETQQSKVKVGGGGWYERIAVTV